MCGTVSWRSDFYYLNKIQNLILNRSSFLLILRQIYLLAAPPSKRTLVIFRMHMTALSGPMLALLLPVVNTRLVSRPELLLLFFAMIVFLSIFTLNQMI